MIALNSVLRDASADHEAYACAPDFVWTPRQKQQPGVYVTSLLPDLLEVATFAETRRMFERHSSYSRVATGATASYT